MLSARPSSFVTTTISVLLLILKVNWITVKYSYCSNNNTVDTVRFCFRQNIVPLKEDSALSCNRNKSNRQFQFIPHDHQIVDYQDSMDIQLQATDQGANSYQSISGGEFGNKKYIHWRLKKNNELSWKWFPSAVQALSNWIIITIFIIHLWLLISGYEQLVQTNVLQVLNGFYTKNSQTSLLELKFAMLMGI